MANVLGITSECRICKNGQHALPRAAGKALDRLETCILEVLRKDRPRCNASAGTREGGSVDLDDLVAKEFWRRYVRREYVMYIYIRSG